MSYFQDDLLLSTQSARARERFISISEDDPGFSGDSEFLTDEEGNEIGFRPVSVPLQKTPAQPMRHLYNGETWPKYAGPPSTWQSWTAEEREIATSLDKLDAQDLAIHLFNCHALRMDAARIRSSCKYLDRTTSTGLQNSAWEPPRSWAAWPLASEEVPRDGDDNGKVRSSDDIVFRCLRPPPSSRLVLEEVFISSCSRKARETFEEREWEDGTLFPAREFPTTGNKPGSSNRTQSRRTKSDSSAKARTSPNSTSPPDHGSPPSPSHSDGSNPSRHVQPDRNFSNRCDLRIPSPAMPKTTIPLRPGPLTDDDRATVLLRRPARHFLSYLDAVLMALHHSRESYAHGYRNGVETPSDTASSKAPNSIAGSQNHSRSRNHSRQPRAHPSRRKEKKKRKRSPVSSASSSGSHFSASDASSTSDSSSAPSNPAPQHWRSRRSSTHSQSRARSGSRPRHSSHRRRLGLRDWSDVLGAAAICGFDSAVVQAAQRRCETLFAAKMDFVDLDENRKGAARRDDGAHELAGSGAGEALLPAAAEEDENDAAEGEARRGRTREKKQRRSSRSRRTRGAPDEMEEEAETEEGVHVDGFLRPIAGRKGWRGKGKGQRSDKHRRQGARPAAGSERSAARAPGAERRPGEAMEV